MSDYNEGDLVEAVKGTTVLRGRLKRSREDGPDPILVLTPALKSDIVHLASNGYTVTVIERAKPALPTEPGHYLHRNGIDVLSRTASGSWIHDGRFTADNAIRDCQPLQRLEPVAETAKKVLDRVRARVDTVSSPGAVIYEIAEDTLAQIAVEFGVTGGLGE